LQWVACCRASVTQQRSCRIDASTDAKIMADLSEVAGREC
jgi:hypothetical protein